MMTISRSPLPRATAISKRNGEGNETPAPPQCDYLDVHRSSWLFPR